MDKYTFRGFVKISSFQGFNNKKHLKQKIKKEKILGKKKF